MKNKVAKLVGVSILSFLFLSSCKGKTESTSRETDSGANRITWMNILHTASPPTDTIVDILEKNTNTELTFNWVPDASKEERLTTALASNELGDIVTLSTVMLENSSVRNSLKSGMFWDVEKYLDDYENLSQISEDRIKASSVDGVLYGVPIQKDFARSGLILRKDWLDNLGLDVPTTMDELYEVAKQFTEGDPDGNGVQDTVGFGDRAPTDIKYTSFKMFTSYFGAPNGWKVENDGSFIPEFETDEYMEALNYSRDLYKNGYLAQDFSVTQKTDQQQQFAQGKTGIYTGMIDISNLKNMAKGIQDNMELVAVNKISSQAGDDDYHVWSEGSGSGGILAFPKSQVKTEEELKIMLQFVNDLINEENFLLMTGGIEGTHYKYNDDNALEYLDIELWQKDVQPLSSSRPSEITYKVKDADKDKEIVNELVKENDGFAVLDPSLPLDSATNNEVGSEIQKLITDATIQYIMGQTDKAGFDKAVSDWNAQGGKEIKEEYAKAYSEAN